MIYKANTRASLALLNYDKLTLSGKAGALNQEPTQVEYELNSVVIETITFAYNSDDELETATDSAGRVLTPHYDAYGSVDYWTIT